MSGGEEEEEVSVLGRGQRGMGGVDAKCNTPLLEKK